MPDWNSLDSVRNAHSFLELWSIWLFAVLVVCDIVAHLIEDNHKSKAKFIERVGLLCFAFAVAAELGAYKYGQRNDELSDKIIRSLSTTAGQAATDSQNALRDSNTALTRSAQAETQSGKATTSASNALTVAKGATIEAASAKKALTKVNEDVARVEEKYAPRTLSKSDRDALIKVLKDSPVHPDTAVELDSFIGATDGVSFGMEIVNAINDPATGWKARFGAQNTVGGELKGVVILFNDQATTHAWSLALQRALRNAGLSGDAVYDPALPAGGVMILVAPKN